MCEYCEKEEFEKKYKNELYKSFPIVDDYSEKLIDINKGDTPIQYIRKHNNEYELVTELVNEDGDVISTEINYCPMCRKEAREMKRYASGYWYQFIIPRRLTLLPVRIYRWLNFFWRLKDKGDKQ